MNLKSKFKKWMAAQYWIRKAHDYRRMWDDVAVRAKYSGMNCSERRSAFIRIMEAEGLVQGKDFVACNPTVRYWDKKDWQWKTNMHMFIELYGTNEKKNGKQVLNGYRIDPSAPDTEIVKFWKGEYGLE